VREKRANWKETVCIKARGAVGHDLHEGPRGKLAHFWERDRGIAGNLTGRIEGPRKERAARAERGKKLRPRLDFEGVGGGQRETGEIESLVHPLGGVRRLAGRRKVMGGGKTNLRGGGGKILKGGLWERRKGE